jgi:hypothetical protein
VAHPEHRAAIPLAAVLDIGSLRLSRGKFRMAPRLPGDPTERFADETRYQNLN